MGESCTIVTPYSLVRRSDDALSEFLTLVQSPFQQALQTNSFLSSFGVSVGSSILIVLAWSFVRPHHSVVYAPKARVADQKRAPPPIGKGVFSWLKPLVKCGEADLVDRIGMDAIIFLRFMRFCRLLFLVLSILGCVVMIPVNITCNLQSPDASSSTSWEDGKWYVLLSPYYATGNCMWAHVVMAWVFDLIIMFLLWRNYRHVLRLKRQYFESPEYTNSLHSRTLMITDVPNSLRSDNGLDKIVGKLPMPGNGDEKCAIGRDVKELPELIVKHKMAVEKVEGILAKYLKNPDRLPPMRPVCYPDKDDKSMSHKIKVDAIEYYRNRIHELEQKIITVRATIDKRSTMSYGFVSYPTISRAHLTAKVARHKHPKGTTIKLAPKPNDIIWRNLERKKAARGWNSFIGNVFFVALSVLYIVPNALIAVFLSNLGNIALLWDEFNTALSAHPTFWGVVQGILAPTVTSIIYLLLPSLMRRISAWQGDLTKSARDRHVTAKLYFFFVFNNLIIFTLFGTLWTVISKFVDMATHSNVSWSTIQGLNIKNRMAIAIVQISTFWITYLLQRNMGAALDIAQVVSLVGKSFAVRFLSPTPRQRIAWTAPPPFEYSMYYNYFLYYVTIALVFSTIQPLVLPVVFLYFLFDSFLKKYILMYIFVTKNESGGTFWRLAFNRILFAAFLFNVVVGLIVWVRFRMSAAACVLPLFLLLLVFKIYCHRTFDMKIQYYTRGSDRDSMIRTGQTKLQHSLEKRYGHPSLHEPLLKPMVAGKAQHLMAEIYYGKSDMSHAGKYEGMAMDSMQRGMPGRRAPSEGFEVVEEEDMDFANFKNRPEFAADHGAGALFDAVSIRSGTPTSSRPGSPGVYSTRGRFSHSPLAAGGGGGYRGTDYVPVANPALPHLDRGLDSPGYPGPYAESGSFVDERGEETDSVRGLLAESQRPGASSPVPGPYAHTQFGRQQHYDSYDDYRGGAHHMR